MLFENDKPCWVHGWLAIKKEGEPNNQLHLTEVPLRYIPADEPKRYAGRKE